MSTAMDDVDERSRLLPQHDEDSGDAPGVTPSRPEISAAFPRRTLIHCILIFTLSFLFLASFFFQWTPLLKALTRNVCHRVRPDLDPDSPECFFQEDARWELVLFTRLNYVFNNLPGILSALPYGYLADQYGRKRGLYLALVGSALAQLSCIIIYFWPDVFHYRLAWISPFFMFIGGGTLVFASLLFTMLSDIAPDAYRTSTFFGMSASMLAAGQLVSPLTSSLMLKNIWLPVFVGISLYIPIIAIALYLPETLHLKALPGAGAPDLADATLDNQEERDIDIESHERPSWIHRWRSFTEEVYSFRVATLSIFWGNRQVTLLLLTMLLAHLGQGAQSTLLPYVYGRFGWNPLKAEDLLRYWAALSFILLVFLLPAVNYFLTIKKAMLPKNRDLLLARICIILLVVGYLVVGLAGTSTVLLIGLVISCFGFPLGLTLRGLLSELVEGHHHALLFTSIGLMESLGNFISGLFVIFYFGFGWGGSWQGVLFLTAAFIFALAVPILYYVRVR